MKRNAIVTGAIITVIVVFFAALFLAGAARACEALVGTAKTEVYVRDVESGGVVGCLYRNDRVVVLKQKRNGWDIVQIGGKKYRVYGEYLTVEDCCLDEVKLRDKPRKSKSGGNGTVRNKTKHSIKGSIFDGIGGLW